MFPIILDSKQLNIILIGDGVATARRKELLEEAGYELYRHSPSFACSKTIGESIQQADCPIVDFINSGNDGLKHYITNADIVFIADFDDATTERIYKLAKAAGALVNAEDKKAYCDFHVPAIVRRGDLLLTVSTNAKSPRLARRIRQNLQVQFGEEWAERLESLGQQREQWRAEGVSFQELADRSDKVIDDNQWLKGAA